MDFTKQFELAGSAKVHGIERLLEEGSINQDLFRLAYLSYIAVPINLSYSAAHIDLQQRWDNVTILTNSEQ